MTNPAVDGIAPVLRKNLHLYKQILATIASCCLSMVGGITFGYTAVLLPQLKEDPDYPYDPAFDSWIASISPLAMAFGSLLAGPISDAIGRRTGQIFLVFPYSIGWFVMGIANNNTIMLLGRFITGICTGAIRPLGMVYIGEVSAPKYRAVTLLCPAIAIFVGSFLSHTVGLFLPWKASCFFFALPNVVCIILLMFLKESPIWLITKGKTKEGIESFKEFRGDGEVAEKELKSILEKHENKATVSSLKDTINVVCSNAFFKSIMTIFLLFVAVQFCGVNTISFYAQDIFKSTFSGEVDEFMMMLVTDVVRIIPTALMCFIANKIPRKVTFIISCYGTVLVLLCLITYLYIKPVGLLWISITCLILYLGIAGIMGCVSWSFISEIFPSRVRGFGSGLSSMITFILLFISVKVTPGILSAFGDITMYGSFAVLTLISGVFLTFLLPETNGRTLQDIENSLYNKNDVEMQSEHSSKQNP